MAALPPRKNSSASRSTKQASTPLQILLQMGFPKQRAEKALAATGNRGVQLAADWLLAHVNDPTLDTGWPREYVVYLCPIGVLLEQLQNFWTTSLVRCGRNGAHNQLPHITLCSFFKAQDDAIPHLTQTLRSALEQFQQELPEKLTLDLYTSSNFLGLFVADHEAEILKKLAVYYAKEVSKYNVSAEPASKALHLTLAYQFPPEQYNILNELARSIDTNATAGWELRLYSRDPRISGNEVHKVIYSHVPQDSDELELLIGDFVYVNSEKLSNSTDGWVEGTSWLSGNSGYLPKNYIEKTAESDAWTLHRAIVLNKISILDDAEELNVSRRPPLNLIHSVTGSCNDMASVPSSDGSKSISETCDSGSDSSENRTSVYENVDFKMLKPLEKSPTVEEPPKLRNLLVIRHGERVDFTFGAWIPFCFDNKGSYIRKDLNMPKTVPPRTGGPQDFYKDCPLTEIGLRQASLTGEALHESGFTVDHVYCSPSLRCVQTCTNVLKGMGLESMPINIEPGLFEWLAWYQDSMPAWMTVAEMKDWGFNVVTSYKPLISLEELHDCHESSEQYYMRNYYVTQSVLKATADVGGNVLFVGHAATLDTCTRQLCGLKPRTAAELSRLVHKIPYCSVSMAEETRGGGSWTLVAPPVPGIMHSGNIRYDWKALQS